MAHDNSPATKGDLELLRTSTDDAMRSLRTDLAAWKEELKGHFEVIAEKLRADLLGMHKDKISLLDDTTVKHERRIAHLERLVGVAAE
jgi:hypothetical protein